MNANVESLRNGYDAFAKGDIPTVLEILDPKIKWTEAEGSQYSGTYIGHEAVVDGVFKPLGTEWDRYEVKPAEFIDAGETVVVLGEYSGKFKSTGKSFSADFAHIWRFSGGKAVRFDQYADTAVINTVLGS